MSSIDAYQLFNYVGIFGWMATSSYCCIVILKFIWIDIVTMKMANANYSVDQNQKDN